MAYTTVDDPSSHFQTDKYTADNTSDTVTFDGNLYGCFHLHFQNKYSSL